MLQVPLRTARELPQQPSVQVESQTPLRHSAPLVHFAKGAPVPTVSETSPARTQTDDPVVPARHTKPSGQLDDSQHARVQIVGLRADTR